MTKRIHFAATYLGFNHWLVTVTIDGKARTGNVMLPASASEADLVLAVIRSGRQ